MLERKSDKKDSYITSEEDRAISKTQHCNQELLHKNNDDHEIEVFAAERKHQTRVEEGEE
jgi:hypothetical protein